MPFFLVHAGSKIQKVAAGGSVTDVTLPAGVTMSTSNNTKFLVFDEFVFAVNGPSINLRINPSDLTATRPMSIPTPSTVITAATGAAGVLTGDYIYKVSFVERSGSTIISESPLSDASNTVTLAAQRGSLTSIPTSTAAGVTDRRLYRTTAGGSTFFPLDYVADNVTTTYTDNTADASLGTTAADTDLGNPAGTGASNRMTLLTAWKDRLWGTASDDVDKVFFSGINQSYAWSAANFLLVGPKGQNTTGVTAFLPRRDELGIARLDKLVKVIGNSAENFEIIDVVNGVGVIASESVAIIRDTAYFLASDGPYSWGAEGVKNISTEKTAAWFTTDDYFPRSMFSSAFGLWNAEENTYELHMTFAPTTNSVVGALVTSGDVLPGAVWVSYHIDTGLWTGPHRSSALSPTCGTSFFDDAGRGAFMLGTDTTTIYKGNDPTFLDGSSGIALDVITGLHTGGEPDAYKYWGRLSVYTKPQAAGSLTVTPTVGNIGDTAADAFTADLTLDSQFLGRVGLGRTLKLRFQHSTASQDCQLFGYQVDPVNIVGQR